jgi:hypothetical protein
MRFYPIFTVTFLAMTTSLPAGDVSQSTFYFPPAGEAFAHQFGCDPSEVGLKQEIVARIEAHIPTGFLTRSNIALRAIIRCRSEAYST